MTELKVPDYFSKARACALSGHARGTIDRWIAAGHLRLHGDFNQISRAELEVCLRRPIDMAAWDAATVLMSHKAMRQDAA